MKYNLKNLNGIDSNDGKTPLLIALTNTHPNSEIIRILLENKADPNFIYKAKSPLHLAIVNEKPDKVIEQLLEHKGKKNIFFNIFFFFSQIFYS